MKQKIKSYMLAAIAATCAFSFTACRVEIGVDNIFNYVDRTMHPFHRGTNSPGTTVFAALSLRFNQGKTLAFKKKSGGGSARGEEADSE